MSTNTSENSLKNWILLVDITGVLRANKLYFSFD